MLKQVKPLFRTVQAQARSERTFLIKYIAAKVHVERSRPEIQLPVWCVDIIPAKNQFGLG